MSFRQPTTSGDGRCVLLCAHPFEMQDAFKKWCMFWRLGSLILKKKQGSELPVLDWIQMEKRIPFLPQNATSGKKTQLNEFFNVAPSGGDTSMHRPLLGGLESGKFECVSFSTARHALAAELVIFDQSGLMTRTGRNAKLGFKSFWEKSLGNEGVVWPNDFLASCIEAFWPIGELTTAASAPCTVDLSIWVRDEYVRGVHQRIQGNPYPQDFSEIMPFSGNSMGKIPILSKCSAQAPLASKLTKILDLSYTVRQRCEAFDSYMGRKSTAFAFSVVAQIFHFCWTFRKIAVFNIHKELKITQPTL